MSCKVLASSRLLGRIYILSPSKTSAQNQVRRLTHGGLEPNQLSEICENEMSIVICHADTLGICNVLFTPNRWVRIQCGPFASKLGYVLDVKALDLLRVAVITGDVYDEDGNVIRDSKLTVDAAKDLRFTEGANWLLDETDIWSELRGPRIPSAVTIISVYGIHTARQEEPHAYEVELFTRLSFDTRRTTNRSFLQTGDNVRVVNGDVSGMVGVVHEISNDIVRLDPTPSECGPCPPHLWVPVGDVERLFEVGRPIIVRIGRHANRIGYIVSTNGSDLTVLDRGAQTQVCA